MAVGFEFAVSQLVDVIVFRFVTVPSLCNAFLGLLHKETPIILVIRGARGNGQGKLGVVLDLWWGAASAGPRGSLVVPFEDEGLDLDEAAACVWGMCLNGFPESLLDDFW